jgi:nucleoside-diphosphate-sugar epimerase
MTKTALVTGASGFIGRHFTRYLRDTLGYRVDAIDLVESDGVMRMDANQLFTGLATAPPYDLVVHAAYHVGGRAVIDGNPSVLALNLALDANMFEWAMRTRQKHVLYFSSSAVYPVELQTGKAGVMRPYRLREEYACIDLPILPDARYGWAKLTGEKLAAAAREEGLTVTVVRPFSGYGSDQSTSYPFPALIGRVMEGEDPVTVWGSGNQVRDWIHVYDVIRGAMAAVCSQVDVVNLGTGVGTSMAELITLAAQAAGRSTSVKPLPHMPDGVFERVADTRTMVSFYVPVIDIEEGVRMAVESWDSTQRG